MFRLDNDLNREMTHNYQRACTLASSTANCRTFTIAISQGCTHAHAHNEADGVLQFSVKYLYLFLKKKETFVSRSR